MYDFTIIYFHNCLRWTFSANWTLLTGIKTVFTQIYDLHDVASGVCYLICNSTKISFLSGGAACETCP